MWLLLRLILFGKEKRCFWPNYACTEEKKQSYTFSFLLSINTENKTFFVHYQTRKISFSPSNIIEFLELHHFNVLTDSSCSVTSYMIHIRKEHVVSWEDMRL